MNKCNIRHTYKLEGDENVPVAFTNAVNAGAISVVEPKVKPWGQTVAYVRDIDGILIEIASLM